MGVCSIEYNRLERSQSPAHVDIAGNGNPHQAYWLWGVQLGINGLLLSCAPLFYSPRESLNMAHACARSMQSEVLALALAYASNASIHYVLISDFFFPLSGLLVAFGFARMARRGQHGMPA